jgi:hypothetical protein
MCRRAESDPLTTLGDGQDCPSCGQTKPYTEFGRNRSQKDGLSFYCLECNRARSNQWYRNRRRSLGKEVRDLSWVPDGFRWCPTCRQAVPIEDYTRNAASATGFGGHCKRCHNEQSKDAYLLRVHGISRAEVDAMRAAQDDQCAICGDETPEHLDHDHESGLIRALLCQRCNQGLDMFRDSPSFLRAAADYIEQHRARQSGGPAAPSNGPTASTRPGAPPVGSKAGPNRRRLHPGACARVRAKYELREADE